MSEPTEPLVCPHCGLEEVTDNSSLDGCGCDDCDPPVEQECEELRASLLQENLTSQTFAEQIRQKDELLATRAVELDAALKQNQQLRDSNEVCRDVASEMVGLLPHAREAYSSVLGEVERLRSRLADRDAEIERLREALEDLLGWQTFAPGATVDRARAALDTNP